MPDVRRAAAAAALLLLCRFPAWATTPDFSDPQSGGPGLWRLAFVAFGALVALFVAIPSWLQLRKTLRRIEAPRQEEEGCWNSAD